MRTETRHYLVMAEIARNRPVVKVGKEMLIVSPNIIYIYIYIYIYIFIYIYIHTQNFETNFSFLQT